MGDCDDGWEDGGSEVGWEDGGNELGCEVGCWEEGAEEAADEPPLGLADEAPVGAPDEPVAMFELVRALLSVLGVDWELFEFEVLARPSQRPKSTGSDLYSMMKTHGLDVADWEEGGEVVADGPEDMDAGVVSDALAGCETDADAGVGLAEAAWDVPEGAVLVDRLAESVESGAEEAAADAVAEGEELAETTD